MMRLAGIERRVRMATAQLLALAASQKMQSSSTIAEPQTDQNQHELATVQTDY